MIIIPGSTSIVFENVACSGVLYSKFFKCPFYQKPSPDFSISIKSQKVRTKLKTMIDFYGAIKDLHTCALHSAWEHEMK